VHLLLWQLLLLLLLALGHQLLVEMLCGVKVVHG
jgi:hypothetical protein